MSFRSFDSSSRALLVVSSLSVLSCRALLGIDDGEPKPDDPHDDGGSPALCDETPRGLKLWTMALGLPDYAALKNPTRCSVELAGVTLLFDDRDEPFPMSKDYDCEVRLPDLLLAPGASVRVHDVALPGDIDVVAAKVSACDGRDISFNPERGGAAYLCDGPCDPATVFDMVAHRGYTPALVDPPPFQFEASFADPLGGIDDPEEAQATRFQRVASGGSYPNFLGGDWAFENRTLFADFEESVSLRIYDQPEVPWVMAEGQPAEIRVSTDAAFVQGLGGGMEIPTGTLGLSFTHTGSDGISTALTHSLETLGNPRAISYFARVSSPDVSAGHVELLLGGTPVIALSFEPSGLGAQTENGTRVQAAYTPGAFSQVELRDIDWTSGTFDLYVDRVLLGSLHFLSSAASVDEVRIYSVTAGSTVHLDGLEFWQ